MKFAIGSAIITFCQQNTFERFCSTFNIEDVLNALELPRNPAKAVYSFLRDAKVCDLGDDWEELDIVSTSKGNQVKYFSSKENAYVKLRFFYDGKYWNDFLVEVIASNLFSTAPLGINIVKQLPVWTPKGWGCYSRNFCKEGKFVTFNSILRKHNLTYPENDRFQFVLNVYKEYLNLDALDYLTVVCVTDTLLLNEDRHLNNIGVLFNDGMYSIPPLFDNGLGLFEHDIKYENLSYDTALRKVRFKPFHTHLEKVLEHLPNKSKVKECLELFEVSKEWMYPNELAYKHLRTIIERLKMYYD